MKQIILIFAISIFQLNSIYGQITENDTVFVKRTVHTENIEIDTLIVRGGINSVQQEILIGTTFLPYSDKMIGLLNKGISPISFEVIKECDNSISPKYFKKYPKFVMVKKDTTSLTIDVTVVANCCHNFLGEAEVKKNNTLNLIYTSYGGFCSCNCCFTLRYKFDTTMEDHYQILKYVTINDSETVELIPEE